MNTAPDPRLVREIAREATQRAARRRDHIGSVLSEHAIMDEILASGDRSAYRRWYNAIKAETQAAAITVSWPDEQPETVHDDGHAARVQAWLDRTANTLSRADVRALLWDRVEAQAEQRDAEDRAEFITELLGAVVAPTCEQDSDGNCATHGELVLESGTQCPHSLARAFLAGARLHTVTRTAERDANAQAVPAGHGPGVPGAMHLEAFGQTIADAFGTCPYHVGSSATSKTWRDVDVRLILDDDRFHALFPGFATANHIDAFWSLLCAALSELGRARTGLPIDFQIQSMTEANTKYNGIRNPLFLIHSRDEHMPTMTAPAVTEPREHEQTRTPEQWCARYGVEVHDPDGWRHADAPAWDEPITLADFYTRAQESTIRNCATVDWNRIARDARAAEPNAHRQGTNAC